MRNFGIGFHLIFLSIIPPVCLTTTFSLAQDWSSCEYDLGRVRRAASNASYSASDVESKAREAEGKRDELQSCLDYPSMYDYWSDGCQSLRSEYESAKDDYESAKSSLESELHTLGSRLQSVQWSCGYTFSLRSGLGRSLPSQKQDIFCQFLQKYKARMSIENLLAVCRKSRSEEECRKCLQ